MLVLKLFLDPIGDLEPWLNHKAQEGYRLTGVRGCFYNFEPSTERYSYHTQYLGCNRPADNQRYLQLLSETDFKVFRAPLNQANFALGRFKLRPYSSGAGVFANSFQDLNREILIVETPYQTAVPLLTDAADISEQYRHIRRTYAHGSIVMFCLSLIIAYILFYKDLPTASARFVLFVALLFSVALVLNYLLLAWRANRKI